MAFTLTTAKRGDDFIREGNMWLKRPKSGYTAAVGDIVILDATVAHGVDEIASAETGWGIVVKIDGNGNLLCAQFVPGTSVELKFASAPSLGQKADFSSATNDAVLGRTVVAGHNSQGMGVVVAVDADCPHGTGFGTVAF